MEHNSISRKSSHLSQQFEASENLEQSAGVVECEDIDSSSDSSSDAEDDGFTFVKKDGEDILSSFPRSTSPLVIDTIANEHNPETEIEADESFEKPEVILKSALVNPNCEDELSHQENDQINESEEIGFNAEPVVPTEIISEFENREERSSVEHNIEDINVSVEEHIESGNNFEEFEKESNIEKEEDIQEQVKENPLFTNEDTQDIKETPEPEFNTEQHSIQSASPLEVAPAVNTLNALEDYMNQDLVDAESSSAPSSLESQSGPASVIIESQEVPIPDQASFIIKPTESQPIDLPSPQEAVVEVLPEEHFRERSQSPILEENEDMSDSESKSPVPTSQLNGNGFEADEMVESEIIRKDSHNLKECTPEPKEEDSGLMSNDIESHQNANFDHASNENDNTTEDKTDIDVVLSKEEQNITEESALEQTSQETNDQCANDSELLIDNNPAINDMEAQKENVDPSSNEPVQEQAQAQDVEADIAPPSITNDAVPSDLVADQNETEFKEEKIGESFEKLETDNLSTQAAEVESADNKIPSPEPPMEEENVDMKVEENIEATEGLSLKCNETPVQEQYVCDEPPTAEVTEGKVGFYAEIEPPVELNAPELKEDIIEQVTPKEEETHEDIRKELVDVKQEFVEEVKEEIKEEVSQIETKVEETNIEKVEQELIIPEPATTTEAVSLTEETKPCESQALQSDVKEESVLLTTPEVNFTPATPIPDIQSEINESPLEIEVKVPETEQVTELAAVAKPSEEKDTKKVEAKKSVEGKTAASPSPKRSAKPAVSKPTTSSKTSGTTVSSPKPKTRPTATKPSSTPVSRAASTSASKQPTPGSTLASRRPASGTTPSRSTPVSSTATARSSVAAKPLARTPTPRTATTTPSRQPLSARTPATKPKTAGASSTTPGAKPSSLTSRTIASRPPVAKPKVDEPKKTATSSVSARSTITRTASPASGSRSRTPVSPKTTVPKTTRSTASTTSRSTLTSTTATSRASTKTATTSSNGAAATRKAPTPRTAPVRTTPTTASSRTTASRTAGASSRATAASSTSPAKKPLGSDLMRRPLVPSGPRPTDLTKKRIPSAKDKQQSSSTKSIASKTKTTGATSTPEENGVEKTSNDSQIKVNGGSTPDEAGQLINGTNGGDENMGSGQNPSTPVNSSGAASPIGEPGQASLANGVL